MARIAAGVRSARLQLAISIIGVLALPTGAAAQPQFADIVTFGTSLSDSGNAFVLLGEQATPPDFDLSPLLVPSAPYARGGHHLTNGPTWIEQLAKSLGMVQSAKPALRSSDPFANNFAVGAARAYADGVNYNLSLQVDAYLERSGGVASAQTLYVIEMGTNDIRDAMAVYAAGGNGAPIVSLAVSAIAANIQRLYAAGARAFLVWLPPNAALAPAVRALGPAAGALATQVTQAFNAALAQTIAQLAVALPGSTFTALDAYSLLDAIVAAPAAFGLTNVVAPCLTPDAPPFTCSRPDEYLFWDGVHPTTAGHAILARAAANVVQ